jgi:hypothetical protein
MKTLKTLADVASYLGAAHPTNESISHRVYKDTECGAWARVETEGTKLVFRVGSIVEGVDAEVFPETVTLPCTGDQIDKAIEDVESAANDIWLDTHGCEDCNTDEHDHRVNPDCPSCGGNGVVI